MPKITANPKSTTLLALLDRMGRNSLYGNSSGCDAMTMVSDSLRQGVALMKEGDRPHAIDLLQRGLVSLRDSTALLRSASEGRCTGSADDSLLLTALPGLRCTTERSPGSPSILVFDQAICFANEDTMDFESASSATLYNLGLIYHGNAIETGSASMYRKATKLYRMALSVLDGCPDKHDVLYLALCNNICHTANALGDEEGYEHFRVLLMYRVSTCFDRSSEVYDVFFWNAFQLNGPGAGAA